MRQEKPSLEIPELPEEDKSGVRRRPRFKREEFSDEPAKVERKNAQEKIQELHARLDEIFTLGLHLPATPLGREYLGKAVETIHQARSNWEKPNMVIRPQNEAERKKVIDKIYELGARSDAPGRIAYQERVSKELESGKNVSFGEMYQNLAKLNGEDPERVKQAIRRKDELVERLAQRMGGKMDDAFIRSVVDEMFGPNTNYDWGQGSATEYFLTGKRNCNALADATPMVFEELIKKLPLEEQKRYELGMAVEKQHIIGTLTFKRDDGSIDHTLYLQPPTEKLVGQKERTGSPTIPLETVKRAMVSKEPIKITSPVKPGEIVAASPDLDLVVNHPFLLNIKVEGPLRGSGYVREIAEERGIKPVKSEPEKLAAVQELTLSEDANKAVDIRKHAEDYMLNMARGAKSAVEIDAMGLKSPSVEQVKALNDWQGQRRPENIEYGEIEDMSAEVLREVLNTPAEEVGFRLRADDLKKLESALSIIASAEPQKTPLRIKFTIGNFGDNAGHMGYLFAASGIRRMAFAQEESASFKQIQMFKYIIKHAAENGTHDIYIDNKDWTPLEDMTDGLSSVSSLNVHIGIEDYVGIVTHYPELTKNKHLKPWINNLYTNLQLSYFFQTELRVPVERVKQYKVEEILKACAIESEEKYMHYIAGP
ncbi:MAG: hypothetical protein WC641_04325 [Patescibacteria group bacterium]